MLVAKNLDFHVAGMLDKLFQIDRRIIEGVLGLRAGGAVGGLQFGFLAHHPQPLASAASRSFQHYGIADFTGNPRNLIEVIEISVGAWNHRQSRLNQRVPRRGL